jgi:hypothetical protein
MINDQQHFVKMLNCLKFHDSVFSPNTGSVMTQV